MEDEMEAVVVTKQTRPMPPKLAAAFVKAQLVMRPAVKDCINPHFNSKYASLASVTEALKPFVENGIGHFYRVKSTAAGVAVIAVLVHESGESHDSDELEMPAPQRTAQALGSAISYGKRYAISAVTGVVSDEDDDGNAASKASPQKASTPQNAKDMVKALNASLATQKPAVNFELTKATLANAATPNDLRIAWRDARAVGDKFSAAQKESLNTTRDNREAELRTAAEKRLQSVSGDAAVAS